MVQAAMPTMRNQKDGLIINVASTAAKRVSGVAGIAYSASKFGMLGMSLSLTQEAWKFGIRACCLCPDDVNTPIMARRKVKYPPEVLEQFIGHVRRINYMGSRYMRTVKDEDKLRVRTRLAALAGCSADELIITRNTTESLDTVIAGFDWKPGDEAVMANQDYGAMLDQFRLQARRYGMVNRFIDIPMDPKSDDEVVQVYAKAITPKTRLLMICHMVNITGHVLPVRAICDMAHARGVPVMVDGAHAFAHLEYKIPDLHCDYYGASLSEAVGYRGQDVCIIGGANSAGQGALFFSHYARRVTIIVRAAGLAPAMAHYLVERINATEPFPQ